MREASVDFIRSLVGCHVLSESDIQIALTAAGADETLPDGNRKLAQLGSGVTGFLIDFSGATMTLSRDFTSKLKFRVNGTNHRADVAKRTGIDRYLRMDSRPGGNSSGVLALATSAIIGAVYIQTKSLESVVKALYALRILDERLDELNLMELFENETSNTPSRLSADERSPQTEDIDSLIRDTTPFLEFSTPSEIGDLSIFETCYNENGELKRNGLHTMDRISESPRTGDLGQPIGRRQMQSIASLSAHGVIRTGTLHDIELSPQHNSRRMLTPGLDVLLTPNEVLYQSDGFSDWVSSQQSSSQGSTSKRKYVGGMDLQRSKKGCFDREFISTLFQEAEMARAFGLLSPQDTYFRPIIETKLLDFGPELFPGLCIFLLQIGSARSFVTLRAALKSSRETRDHLHSAQTRKWLSRDLTIQERFEVIGEIQENAAYLQILRYNHILNIYRQSGETAGNNSNFTIIAASHDALVSHPRPRGNPRKIAVAEAVDKMTKKIFPELESGSAIYKRKRRTVLEFRKFGQRLHILAQRFGDAVLSLVHFDRLGDAVSPVISEKM
ncbi:unnamed protein product [Penicillium salamii]|uniref:RNase III domain-containing protein n=1 Tax=Penicillium salamii TaxID=1612424 RepID=A0A9W4K529_9EURO|nr:unnamed protein product [Penicillium salamii]CAG8199609.1 unnamed protein product [Penicillium salamii]CAG8314453.1 unnamed protein product [Penicillium salamii]CAG8383492.1 unnamed protein product [Penicillium salamii]CAG8402844.1 unnamed protein product [Penicillium salamii]